MKFGFACCAKIIRLQSVGCASKIFEGIAGFQAREGEMRRVCARFAREAERFERLLDGCGELGEIGSGLDAAPEHAWFEVVGEETENTEIHGDRLRGSNGR